MITFSYLITPGSFKINILYFIFRFLSDKFTLQIIISQIFFISLANLKLPCYNSFLFYDIVLTCCQTPLPWPVATISAPLGVWLTIPHLFHQPCVVRSSQPYVFIPHPSSSLKQRINIAWKPILPCLSQHSPQYSNSIVCSFLLVVAVSSVQDITGRIVVPQIQMFASCVTYLLFHISLLIHASAILFAFIN